jgi:hypothetical protein
MWNVWEREGVHAGVWWPDLKERDHKEDVGVDGRTILRWIFETLDEEA